MLTITTVKFRGRAARDYTSERVNKLARMIARNTTIPHKFVCLTDDPRGLDADYRIINPIKVPDWPIRDNFTKLRAFSEPLSDRVCLLDMDCIVTGDIDPILSIPDPFVIMRGTVRRTGGMVSKYNSSFVMFDYDAAAPVRTFTVEAARKMRETNPDGGKAVGSDQRWIEHVIPDATMIGQAEGVWQYKRLPVGELGRLVFFAGDVKPWDGVRRDLARVYEGY